ncbi:hypothetical protein [Ilumatobacter coccineus]|nr:hypothetical protein [Ilumatobacter coccineus]
MPKPAKLPKGAPKSLRDFVACTTQSVTLDTDSLGWIPTPPGVPAALAPDVNVTAGATPGTATITIGYGEFISMDLPASIGPNGELQVDASDIGFGIGPKIDKWVADFNATLKANGKQLDTFAVDGNKVAMTKKNAVVPAKEPTPPATPAPKVIKPGGPPPVPVPPEKKPSPGCLTWMLVAVTVVAVLVVAAVVLVRGGDDETATIVDVGQTAPAATEPPPTAAPAEPEPSEPPSSASDPGPTTTLIDDDQSFRDALCTLLGRPIVTIYGDLTLPDGSCAPEPDRTSTYGFCPADLPCSLDQPAAIAITGQTGNNHLPGTTDAVSGQTGFSTLLESFLILVSLAVGDLEPVGGPDELYEASADCAGTTVTGAGVPQDDGSVRADLPLFSYGECSNREIRANFDDHMFRFPQIAIYNVDASEREPTTPNDSLYAVQNPSVEIGFDDVNTINNVLGGRTGVDDGCFWFFEPQNVELVTRVLDGCATNNHYWVFAAATTNVEIEVSVTDTVLGTTATYANPLGQVMPTAADISAFRTTDTLFDNSVFPCGFGYVGYTACSEGDPAMETGAFVTVSAETAGSVPLASDGTDRAHHADFTSVGGPRFSATQTADEWVVTSSTGATRARAIIRGTSLTFVIPSDELPDAALAYQWATTVDGNEHVQPVVPVMGLITTPEMTPLEAAEPVEPTEPTEPVEPTAPVETVEEPAPTDEAAPIESLADFYTRLSASVSAGDLGFALDRLDQRVFDVYGDSCPAALESFADPDLVIEFVSAGPIEDWVYEANEQAVEVPGSQAVTIRLSGRGQSGDESVAHLSIVDGTYRWFTFC